MGLGGIGKQEHIAIQKDLVKEDSMLTISGIISFLLIALLVCVLVYALNLIIGMLALPGEVKTIAYLIIALIVLAWLLSYFGLYTLPLR